MKSNFLKVKVLCLAAMALLSNKVYADGVDFQEFEMDTVRIAKAVIQDAAFYVAVKEYGHFGVEGIAEDQRDNMILDHLRAYKKGKRYFYTTFLDNIFTTPHALCWDIDGKYVYTSALAESLSRGVYHIGKSPLEVLDSLEYLEDVYRKYNEIDNTEEEIAETIKKENQAEDVINNRRMFVPIRDLVHGNFLLPRNRELSKLLKTTREDRYFADFNYLVADSGKVEYYVKDKRQLTLWEYSFPESKEKDKRSNWREVRTWCVDTFRLSFSEYVKNRVLPTVENTVYNAIPDSTFLEYHFEVVKQNDHTFLINVFNGHIYWLTDEAILKIGKADIDNQYKRLLGKTLFIEDRDENKLLFFSSVTFDKGAFEYPKIRVIDNEVEYAEILDFFR